MNGYVPLQLGSEDYFSKYAEIINSEIDKAVRKSAKSMAQQAVTGLGQMPYGSSTIQNIMGDIYKGGIASKQKGYTEMALGAALPQFQAQQSWQQLLQGEKFTGEQAELNRILQKELARLGYEMEIAKAEGSKPDWWQYLLGGLGTGLGYGLGL